jgi:hypothetical protein
MPGRSHKRSARHFYLCNITEDNLAYILKWDAPKLCAKDGEL